MKNDKPLKIRLNEKMYEKIRKLAFDKRTTMVAIIRTAIEFYLSAQ